jgi:hypothetical protein
LNGLRKAQCPQESAEERFVARAGASNWRHEQTLAGDLGLMRAKSGQLHILYIAPSSLAFDPRQSALIGQPQLPSLDRPTCIEARTGHDVWCHQDVTLRITGDSTCKHNNYRR